jgi:hypothetical protein
MGEGAFPQKAQKPPFSLQHLVIGRGGHLRVMQRQQRLESRNCVFGQNPFVRPIRKLKRCLDSEFRLLV